MASRTKASGELDSQVDVAQDEDDGPQVCTAEAKRLQLSNELVRFAFENHWQVWHPG